LNTNAKHYNNIYLYATNCYLQFVHQA